MDEFPKATIDVRDMLCAQALAVVAQAIDRLPTGGILAVRYNTADVRQDLAVWAQERGHQLDIIDSTTLHLERS